LEIELEVDDSLDLNTEFESPETLVSSEENATEVMSLLEDSGVDELSEDEDLSLDYVEYDIEELKAGQSDTATNIEKTPEVESSDEMSLEVGEDVMDIEFNLNDVEVELEENDVEVELEEADVKVEELVQNGAENDVLVDGIDLDEGEISDLEAELAEFESDEDLLLETENAVAAESDEGINLDMDEGDEFNLEDFAVDDMEVGEITVDESDADAIDLEGLGLESDSIESDDDDTLIAAEVDVSATDENDSVDDELDLGIDPVFIEILQKEVGAHLIEMTQFVSDSLETEQPEVSDNFVRVVHTLNGAASMASVDGITDMTAPLEKMSIMLMDRKQPLRADDLTQIELVIKHAKSQLNLLGTGTFSVDNSIGDYFVNRIKELDTTIEESKDAEDLIVENNLLERQSEPLQDNESNNKTEVVEEIAEAEASEVVEEVKEDIEEDAPEPFQQIAEAEQTEASVAASELELDEELLEIFSEEASEIFDRADHMLAELEDKPNNPTIIQALQRDLHTLKGGARMAGLNQIGDLSHQLESLFESIAETNHEVDAEQHEMMSQIMHKLHGLVNSDDYGLSASIENETKQLEDMLSSEGAELKEKSKLDEEFFDPLAQVDSPLTEADDVPDHGEEQIMVPKKANVLSGGQIKVNSELLDKLVNFAGEVSIYRSRMEQQSAELKLNIDELENTVERVRRQLRELEHETEAQIISNYQMEGDELEEDFDPLELDQFSTIQQLSRSLSESVSDLTNIQAYLQESARSSETLLIQQSRVNTELQEGLMETRLVTFNSLVPRLRRVLRTAGQELNKTAKLTVNGAEGEMDKTVLEGIQAPLEHMIRNAMVHGIEGNRKKAKKPEQGQIEIELSREATEVVITVKDDGAGINTNVLKKKAIERGIIGKDDKLSDSEIAELITHSGLSAANKVSKLAGRGVGMDVVNNEIKRLGGSIEIFSTQGEGTTFVIRLPYTLALTQAIIVQVADHRYAIPASGVQGLIRMNIDEFRRRMSEGDLGYDYAGEQYQVQELNKLLSVDSEALIEGNQVPLVMIKSGDQGVALRVDQTYGGREIVVKSVGTQVASVPGIFGATILGDGAVVLILDIIPMHRAYLHKLERLEAEGVELVEEVEEDHTITIMVVDDSITMRRAGERMLTRNEFEVMTAKDGLDALNKLQEQKPDLMLLDIEMPRMDGFELATNMKASERFKDIPIIMITSRTGQKHKDRAKEIGVERYLGKPYQEIDLLDNIQPVESFRLFCCAVYFRRNF